MEVKRIMPVRCMSKCPFCVLLLLLLLLLDYNFTPKVYAQVSIEKYRDLGSKTAYRFVYKPNKLSEDDKEWTDKCPLVYAFGYFRHGSRTPSQDTIVAMQHLADKVKLHCEGREEMFCRDYRLPTLYSQASKLTPVGEGELRNIGSRLQQVTGDIPIENIEVLTSSSTRAIDSSRSFMRGFEPTIRHHKVNDTLGSYYKYHAKYSSEVYKTPTAYAVDDYFASKIWKDTLSNVSGRLGFEVKTEDLLEIFKACAFAITNEIETDADMWCSMLQEEDHAPILYAFDAEDYLKFGPHYEATSDAGNDLLSHFLSEADKVANNSALHYRVKLIFGHHAGVLPLLTRLQWYKMDGRLTADNYDALSKNRGFNNTALGPMAANIQLHLHYCQNENNSYYVRPFHNERPMWQDMNCNEPPSMGCKLETFSVKTKKLNRAVNYSVRSAGASKELLLIGLFPLVWWMKNAIVN